MYHFKTVSGSSCGLTVGQNAINGQQHSKSIRTWKFRSLVSLFSHSRGFQVLSSSPSRVPIGWVWSRWLCNSTTALHSPAMARRWGDGWMCIGWLERWREG